MQVSTPLGPHHYNLTSISKQCHVSHVMLYRHHKEECGYYKPVLYFKRVRMKSGMEYLTFCDWTLSNHRMAGCDWSQIIVPFHSRFH